RLGRRRTDRRPHLLAGATRLTEGNPAAPPRESGRRCSPEKSSAPSNSSLRGDCMGELSHRSRRAPSTLILWVADGGGRTELYSVPPGRVPSFPRRRESSACAARRPFPTWIPTRLGQTGSSSYGTATDKIKVEGVVGRNCIP